jgi:hypothetical protein
MVGADRKAAVATLGPEGSGQRAREPRRGAPVGWATGGTPDNRRAARVLPAAHSVTGVAGRLAGGAGRVTRG